MEYTAVIRTLGKAGEKYRCLLDSLVNQTIKPSRILVYIAEGYAIPKETIGWEEYIYVKREWLHNEPWITEKWKPNIFYF